MIDVARLASKQSHSSTMRLLDSLPPLLPGKSQDTADEIDRARMDYMYME
jgi:hypothetical protein